MTVAALPFLREPARGSSASSHRPTLLIVGVVAVAMFVTWQYRTATSFAEQLGDPQALRFQMVLFVVPYLVIVSIGVLAALAGQRSLSVLAPVAYAGVGWVMSASTVSAGVLGSWSSGPAGARLLGFSMALLPCAASGLLVRHPRVTACDGVAPRAASSVLVAGTVGLAVVMRSVVSGTSWDTYLDLIAVAVIAGVCVSTRPVLLPVAMFLSLGLSPELLSWAASGGGGKPPVQELVFFPVLVLAGAVYYPVVGVIAGLRKRPVHLLVVVNALNTADAVATFVAVRAGDATEANPVVDIVGLPAKVVIGLIASSFVARHRPDALLTPIVVLSVVFAWHVLGLLVI